MMQICMAGAALLPHNRPKTPQKNRKKLPESWNRVFRQGDHNHQATIKSR
jgi:hypothetical protein